MIIRSIGARQSQRVIVAPLSRRCLRSLSIETTTRSQDDASSTLQEPPSSGITSAAPISNRIPSAAPFVPPRSDLTVPTFLVSKHVAKKTQSLGSVVDQRYTPATTLKDPPAPKDVTLEMLLAAGAHLGHHTSLWNPANSRYLHGVRAGVHIISLETTAAHLRRAARVVEAVSHAGGLVLFAGTRKGHMPIVVRAAELAGACHLFEKWTPGTITNRDVILEAGEQRVVNELDQPVEGFEEHLRERRPLVPDLVVCLNPVENYTMLYECGLANIPTIGIIDTDADPTWVTYSIPANDDSLRCIAIIAGVLGRAGQLGRAKRLQDAKNGIVTWETPKDVQKFMDLEADRQAEEIQKQVEAAIAEEDEAARREGRRSKFEESLKGRPEKRQGRGGGRQRFGR